MSDILIIHHSLDANSARLLAKALTRLGFDAPVLCDERADATFAQALASGRAAIAIWSSAAAGSAGFTGLASVADAAGKLLSLRGPDGRPPESFGRAFMLAGWDGSDLKHPGLIELVRTLAGRFKARRAREAARVAPISAPAFGGEPPLNPGPASARLLPRQAPAPNVRSAAQAALREEGEVAVLAPRRPAPHPQARLQFEIDPSRITRRAPIPAPARRVAKRRKAWAPVLSMIAGCAAFGALCGAVGALFVGEMAFATHAAPRAVSIEMRAPAVAREAAPAAEIVVAQPASLVVVEPAEELFAAVEIAQAPAPLDSLAPVDLTLNTGEAAPVETLSARVVTRQTVE